MDKWTPRELRSRDKWRQHLVKFQYEHGMSQEEMNLELAKQKIEKTGSSGTTTIVYDSADSNPASYVLKYLLGI